MSRKNSYKEWTDWLFMSENRDKMAFEEKHKKGLNAFRLILIPIIAFILFPILTKPWFWLLFGYIIIVIYKAWIKKVWEFLQKDSIVHYIFLAIIPAVIIIYGYQYVHVGIPAVNSNPAKPANEQKSENAGKSSMLPADITAKEQISQYDEIVDRLNGFYSALFTAIAVIAAVFGIGAWKTINALKEKLENFKKIEDDVEFLRKKSDLAEWVQGKLEKDVDKKILTSISFNLTIEEDKKLQEIKKQILKETTDDTWLKLVYAQQLLEELKNTKSTEEHEFEKIKKIFDYIESRDLFEEDSEIPQLLYHYKGLLFFFWYQNKKFEFIRVSQDKNKPWGEWWEKEKVSKNESPRMKLLEDSVKYYEKAIDLANKKLLKNIDETMGNLAVVLIELSKFKYKNGEKAQTLKSALTHLRNIKNRTFNTYWDKARALYYCNAENNKEEIKKDLDKAEKMIDNPKDKKFFEDEIENERKERDIVEYPGFPGEKEEVEVDKNKTNFLKKIFKCIFSKKK